MTQRDEGKGTGGLEASLPSPSQTPDDSERRPPHFTIIN